MNLLFLVKRQYGNTRYYAVDSVSQAIVKVSGRKCLDLTALNVLEQSGFTIVLRDADTNIEKRFVGLSGLASSLKKGDV